MFKTIAAVLLLTGAGLALASDASYDQSQSRTASAAVSKDASAKNDAPRPWTCSCQHGRS